MAAVLKYDSLKSAIVARAAEVKAEWDEGAHPRDGSGRFASGGQPSDSEGLFHGSAGNNIRSIMENGLLPGDTGIEQGKGEVHLAEEKGDALAYAGSRTYQWGKSQGMTDEQIDELPVAVVVVRPSVLERAEHSYTNPYVKGKIGPEEIAQIEVYRYGYLTSGRQWTSSKEPEVYTYEAKSGVNPLFIGLPPELLLGESPEAKNCGTGAGGFQAGNSCGRGGGSAEEGSPASMSPEAYASRLASMSESRRDNVDLYENFAGYAFYEAQKLMPKKEDAPFRKVTETNSYALHQEADFVANVGGKPYLITKQEDPDEPDEFPKIFIYSFATPEDYVNAVHTTTNDPVELRAKIREWEAGRSGAKSLPAEYLKGLHKFSSTQVNLPPGLAALVLEAGLQIKAEDLTEEGREQVPHCTVKYGIHTDDSDEVAAALEGAAPVYLTIGEVDCFEGEEQDVVMLRVESPGLHELNERLADELEVTDTHPTYEPHVTLAYVKPGEGAKYRGMSNKVSKTTIVADTVVFSDADRNMTAIPLRPARFVPGVLAARIRERALELGLEGKNCGTGSNGFEPGNSCARGGGSNAVPTPKQVEDSKYWAGYLGGQRAKTEEELRANITRIVEHGNNQYGGMFGRKEPEDVLAVLNLHKGRDGWVVKPKYGDKAAKPKKEFRTSDELASQQRQLYRSAYGMEYGSHFGEVEYVDLKEIHGTEKVYEETVDEIRAVIREGGELPPLLVESGGGILDGHHRLEAARLEKVKQIPVIRYYREGDEEDEQKSLKHCGHPEDHVGGDGRFITIADLRANVIARHGELMTEEEARAELRRIAATQREALGELP